MPSITTTKARIHNAIKLCSEPYLYYALSQTSAWPDENNPPTPSVSVSTLTELIYIRRIQVKHLVVVDDPYDGYAIDVEVNGINYNYVLEASAYDRIAYSVYLAETIDYSSIAPTNTTFRTISVLLNPEDAYGTILTGLEYLAASVADVGQIIYTNNRTYLTRAPEQTEMIQTIIRF